MERVSAEEPYSRKSLVVGVVRNGDDPAPIVLDVPDWTGAQLVPGETFLFGPGDLVRVLGEDGKLRECVRPVERHGPVYGIEHDLPPLSAPGGTEKPGE